MGYNFPDAPTDGLVYSGYVWNAAKGAWEVQGAANSGAVRYDTPQGLTDPQKTQGRANIGAASVADVAVGAVRYDTAQNLTEAQDAQARSNIYAAPFDALAYSGMQINGSMEVSQERGITPTATSNSHICDGWKFLFAGTTLAMTGAIQTPYTLFPGFNSVLYTTVSVAQASIGADDFAMLHHNIEGYRVSRLAWGTAAARPITIAFWSAHTRTGLYSVAVRNADDNRSYVFTYTHNGSVSPQYNVVTIPGCPDGTWKTDNNAGIRLVFAIAMGSNSTTSSTNTWLTGTGKSAATGQINGVAATTDVFRITGVVVLPGIEAPSAERSPLIMRPFDQELATCQRYWESTYDYGVAPGTASMPGADQMNLAVTATAFQCTGGKGYSWKVVKRIAPSVTLYSPVTGASNKIRDMTNGVDLVPITGGAIDPGTMGLRLWSAQMLTAANTLSMATHIVANARL